jgi:hypothetical protein
MHIQRYLKGISLLQPPCRSHSCFVSSGPRAASLVLLHGMGASFNASANLSKIGLGSLGSATVYIADGSTGRKIARERT